MKYRILLRQDNADIRVTGLGYNLGLISEKRMKECSTKIDRINQIIDFSNNETVLPSDVNSFLLSKDTAEISQKTKIHNLLLRPQVDIFEFIAVCDSFQNFLKKRKIKDREVLEESEILIKYASYIEKEKEIAERVLRLEEIALHENFDYKNIKALSSESREKLSKIKPKTIGQASRISGVSPADITVLLVQLGR